MRSDREIMQIFDQEGGPQMLSDNEYQRALELADDAEGGLDEARGQVEDEEPSVDDAQLLDVHFAQGEDPGAGAVDEGGDDEGGGAAGGSRAEAEGLADNAAAENTVATTGAPAATFAQLPLATLLTSKYMEGSVGSGDRGASRFSTPNQIWSNSTIGMTRARSSDVMPGTAETYGQPFRVRGSAVETPEAVGDARLRQYLGTQSTGLVRLGPGVAAEGDQTAQLMQRVRDNYRDGAVPPTDPLNPRSGGQFSPAGRGLGVDYGSSPASEAAVPPRDPRRGRTSPNTSIAGGIASGRRSTNDFLVEAAEAHFQDIRSQRPSARLAAAVGRGHITPRRGRGN
jgi:hypothetical protein